VCQRTESHAARGGAATDSQARWWRSALTDEDPAVFKADMAAERWENWLERPALCFIEIVPSESLQAEGERCDFLSDFDDHGVELPEQHRTRLPFPAYPMGEEEHGTR
jgi:hypothetical protein